MRRPCSPRTGSAAKALPPPPPRPSSTRNWDLNPNPVPIAADSPNGFARNRSREPFRAGLGLREGESKWVLGGIGFGCVGYKNGNMGNDDYGYYMDSTIEKSDHKVEIGMNHKILVVVVGGGGGYDDIAGTLGHLDENRRNSPFFLLFILFYFLSC